MDWLSALYGFLGGAAGMLVILFGCSRWLGSYLLAHSEHKWTQELEKLRNTLQQEQKQVQARIDSSVSNQDATILLFVSGAQCSPILPSMTNEQ
jgi:hypothetical protein